jgi:hypothetical protein
MGFYHDLRCGNGGRNTLLWHQWFWVYLARNRISVILCYSRFGGVVTIDNIGDNELRWGWALVEGREEENREVSRARGPAIT